VTRISTASLRFLLVAALLGVGLSLACGRDTRRGDPNIQVRWDIEPSPPAVGKARVRVTVSDLDWAPRNGAHVIVTAVRDSVRMAVDTAVGQGAGQYIIDDFVFQVAGKWTLRARVETNDGRWAEVDHRVRVQGEEDQQN
jgi:hypothetical protein